MGDVRGAGGDGIAAYGARWGKVEFEQLLQSGLERRRVRIEHAMARRWRVRMLALGFSRSGASYRGVEAKMELGGGALRLTMGTEWYAKFQDWGVGRGRPMRWNGKSYVARSWHRRVFYSKYTGEDSRAFLRRVLRMLGAELWRLHVGDE